jgi:Carbohydrate esterase, sialic acid-specific acetylesterase
MGQFAENPWSDAKKLVDQAHQQLPTRVARTAFVSSDGFQHKGDKVHFDSPSLREFGRRYADAYFKLTK